MLPIKVPPLGESIVEATVSRWQKKEGDAVAAGDTLVELETDKITVEVPALKPGVLAKRAKNEGDIVHVDDILGELDETAVPAAAGATQGATAAGKAPTRCAGGFDQPSPRDNGPASSCSAHRSAAQRKWGDPGRAGNAREDVDAPEKDRGESSTIAARNGSSHDVQRS